MLISEWILKIKSSAETCDWDIKWLQIKALNLLETGQVGNSQLWPRWNKFLGKNWLDLFLTHQYHLAATNINLFTLILKLPKIQQNLYSCFTIKKTWLVYHTHSDTLHVISIILPVYHIHLSAQYLCLKGLVQQAKWHHLLVLIL